MVLIFQTYWFPRSLSNHEPSFRFPMLRLRNNRAYTNGEETRGGRKSEMRKTGMRDGMGKEKKNKGDRKEETKKRREIKEIRVEE